MGLTITGLTVPVAMGPLIAFLGYLVGRRRHQEAAPPASRSTTDETDSLIEKIEQLSNELRRSMATHHSTVSRCRDKSAC